METGADPTESPRVKFYWSRSVRCLSKKVYLVISTEFRQICLEWKTGSGWFESAFISLSPGLYTGHISIREKKKCGFFEKSDEVIERQYKIDPFFVTPQRFSIELFIQTGNIPNVWREARVSIKRQAISQPLVSQVPSIEEDSQPKTKYSSSCELGRDYRNINEKLELQNSLSSPDISFDSFVASKSSDSLSESNSNHGLDDLKETLQIEDQETKSLKRWSSIGNKGAFDLTLDYSDLNSQVEQDRDLENFEHHFILASIEGNSYQETIQNEKFQESLKDHYIFSELDPIKGSIKKGYGCLITIESRSTSMDDLGSSRNLENVLVSLSSNDADSKLSANFDVFNPAGTISELVEVIDTSEDFLSDPHFRLSFHGPESIETIDTDSKYPESDFTINEEENFVYDSLKNDDYRIPLNIENLSSTDDSLDYQIPPPKPKRLFAVDDVSVLSRLESSSKDVTDDNSFVLVNPGSLGSDSDIVKPTTLGIPDDYDHTPSEIDLFNAVATVRKLSNEIEPMIETLVLSENYRCSKFINDRPIMSSTGTQTYFKDALSSTHKKNFTNYNRRLKKEQVELSDDSYSPLPCKVQGPWQTVKYPKPTIDRSQISAKSILKSFKRNLQNLKAAEQISRPFLREVNPYSRESMIRDARNLSTDNYTNSNYYNSSSYSSPSLHRSNNYQSQKHLSRVSRYYEVPTTVKELPSPLLSIYGEHLLTKPTRKTKHSTRNSHLQAMKPTYSLPNLRNCYQVESPTLMFSQKYKMRSSDDVNQETSRRCSRKKSVRRTDHIRRRRHKSYDQSKYLREHSSSGGSTESLIEEALNLSRNFRTFSNQTTENCLPKNDADSNGRIEYQRRKYGRLRSKSYNRDSSSEMSIDIPKRRRASMINPNESVQEVERSLRTRSETDLRMIGTFSGGYQGSRPYLPYEQEQLSVGQVVKVLVPGSGVAMARVIYTPQNRSNFLGKNISVLLISEPSNMCGSVINIPMDKILLAWPKHNKENITFI